MGNMLSSSKGSWYWYKVPRVEKCLCSNIYHSHFENVIQWYNYRFNSQCLSYHCVGFWCGNVFTVADRL